MQQGDRGARSVADGEWRVAMSAGSSRVFRWPERALSHQPFLLPTTWLTVGLGINKFNTLESRQDPAREAFLARCDNAPLRRVSIMLHPPGTVVLCDEPRCGTTARPLFPRPRADRRIGHGGRQISVALCRFHLATFCRPQSADIRFSLLSRNTATSA